MILTVKTFESSSRRVKPIRAVRFCYSQKEITFLVRRVTATTTTRFVTCNCPYVSSVDSLSLNHPATTCFLTPNLTLPLSASETTRQSKREHFFFCQVEYCDTNDQICHLKLSVGLLARISLSVNSLVSNCKV